MMRKYVLFITLREWDHAKAISLHAERLIPRILLFEGKVDWCLSLLPQVALQSTNLRANSWCFGTIAFNIACLNYQWQNCIVSVLKHIAKVQFFVIT